MKKKYLYYPGCSLPTSAPEYDLSSRAVMRELGNPLLEIDDWNCCGSTAIEATSKLASMALSARNLAIAEKEGGDLVAACSSCYLNLSQVKDFTDKDPAFKANLEEVLKEAGIVYNYSVRVRHLLDVVVNDIGLEAVAARVKRKLNGITVAPYYGCQIVRPYMEFDGPDMPTSMDKLVVALGGQVVPDYPAKTVCCGASLVMTKRPVALKLIGDILLPAKDADCIITTCPMCQLNVDAWQGAISGQLGVNIQVPVLYFTQLIGLAFDLSEDDLRLDKNIVSPSNLVSKIRNNTSELAARR